MMVRTTVSRRASASRLFSGRACPACASAAGTGEPVEGFFALLRMTQHGAIHLRIRECIQYFKMKCWVKVNAYNAFRTGIGLLIWMDIRE